MKCNGKPGCEVHPHLRVNHPTEPVLVVTIDGAERVDYSGAWDRAEAEWQRLTQTPEYQAMMRGFS